MIPRAKQSSDCLRLFYGPTQSCLLVWVGYVIFGIFNKPIAFSTFAKLFRERRAETILSAGRSCAQCLWINKPYFLFRRCSPACRSSFSRRPLHLLPNTPPETLPFWALLEWSKKRAGTRERGEKKISTRTYAFIMTIARLMSRSMPPSFVYTWFCLFDWLHTPK